MLNFSALYQNKYHIWPLLNTLVLESIKYLGNELFIFLWKSKIQTLQGPFVLISNFFKGVKFKFFCFKSKQIPYLVHSKYFCIRIDKNILGINILFFNENKKFRLQEGPFVYISDFSEDVKGKFFSVMYV